MSELYALSDGIFVLIRDSPENTVGILPSPSFYPNIGFPAIC